MDGRVNIQAVSFPRYTGESMFQVRHGERSKRLLLLIKFDMGNVVNVYCCGWWDSNPRPKNPWSVETTPFADELVGY